MIDLECSEIKDIVESIRFDEASKELELTFTSISNNKRITSSFNPIQLDKSLRSLEDKLLKEIPSISSDFRRIENTIINNLKKLIAYIIAKKDGNKHKIIRYLRKYENDGKLYESAIIDKLPKFIVLSHEGFDLVDEIEEGDYIFHPADSVTTHNPLPYSFESAKEFEKYLELAKKETIDSLFEKVYTEFKKYLNAEDHTLVILSADTVYSFFQE